MATRFGASWNRARLWPFALVAFLYLATSPYHRGLNNPNEMVRIYMSKAIVDHQTVVIDPVIASWGIVDDKAIRDGKLYSSKAPLHSLLGVPVYALVRPIATALWPSAEEKRAITHLMRLLGAQSLGILCAWVLLSWVLRRGRELGASVRVTHALGLSLCLGTMLYPYALTFTGHILAALTAGGCYLAVIALARQRPGSGRWRAAAVLAGFLGGAAPFAEYPAALLALPALLAALFTPNFTHGAKGLTERVQLAGWLLLGGIIPFGLGLYAHDVLWGSPFKTGYSFLENTGYIEVHRDGFFGVGAPKGEALVGALFSPGTGLFFFSPVLIVGLAALLRACFARPSTGDGDAPTFAASANDPSPIPRAIAIAGLIGFILEVLFIAGHKGWRGGWTLGPRYIIAVAPLLGLWTVEALRFPRVRASILGLGAASILLTGFAAALYPHLSDVYTNPLRTFLWPTYLRGETTYGLGHIVGLVGHAANLVHVVPLAFTLAFVLFASLARHNNATTAAHGRWRPHLNALWPVGLFGACVLVVAVVPERAPSAAHAENARLWGFWEPKSPRTTRKRGDPRFPSASDNTQAIEVWAIGADGKKRMCVRAAQGCRYGEEAWQRFGPEQLRFEGVETSVLFWHPVQGWRHHARVPVPLGAKKALFRYGLSDESAASQNTSPVKIRVGQGGQHVKEVVLRNDYGLKEVGVTLTSTAPLTVELWVEGNDGARVVGVDAEFEN